MGSKKSASSGGTSPGESKARVGTTEITGTKNAQKAQSKVIGKRADDYARKKLGIVETKGGFQDRNVTGYKSTTGNQMYGAAYNEARGEYLSSLGLAKAREATDAMGNTRTVYDPRTADGTYNNLTRDSMNEAKANKTPLSKEMYASQQKFKTGIGVVAALMGAPIIPGILFTSAASPYSNYVNQTREQGFYNFSSTQKSPIDNVKNIMSKSTEEFADETEAEKQQKKTAGSGQSLSTKERSLFARSPKTFNV